MDSNNYQTPRISPGFVYIMANPCMPDLVKVGQTERHPGIRAVELSTHSGVPMAFEVAFYVEVVDRIAAEKTIHSALAEFRVGNDREFFRGNPDAIIKTILDLIWDLVPEQSPFLPYLNTLKNPNKSSPLQDRDPNVCPQCNGRMIFDAFKIHRVCANCGHVI